MISLMEKRTSSFNLAAAKVPETDFFSFLKERFDRDTALRVIAAFDKIKLPPPEDRNEFLAGTEGALLFLNRQGLVIRIEIADTKAGTFDSDRVDSGWVLKPLATLKAGNAVIEICPGCVVDTKDEKTYADLSQKLEAEDINFWDFNSGNVGRLPFKISYFPKGVPVVIDRLAVRKVTGGTFKISQKLKERSLRMAARAAKAQDDVFKPLRQALDEGYGTDQIQKFWALCEKYVEDKLLVAGWNATYETVTASDKSAISIEAARHYEMHRYCPALVKFAESLFIPALDHQALDILNRYAGRTMNIEQMYWDKVNRSKSAEERLAALQNEAGCDLAMLENKVGKIARKVEKTRLSLKHTRRELKKQGSIISGAARFNYDAMKAKLPLLDTDGIRDFFSKEIPSSADPARKAHHARGRRFIARYQKKGIDICAEQDKFGDMDKKCRELEGKFKEIWEEVQRLRRPRWRMKIALRDIKNQQGMINEIAQVLEEAFKDQDYLAKVSQELGDRLPKSLLEKSAASAATERGNLRPQSRHL